MLIKWVGGVRSREALGFLAVLFLLVAGTAADFTGGDAAAAGLVSVDGSTPMATTDDDFVCATLDWWGPTSILNLDLSNPILLNAVKAFSPLKLRLGGTLQDNVLYGVGDPARPCLPFIANSSHIYGSNPGCLSKSRWDQLNYFFRRSGAKVLFGLNALNGRVPMPDGSVGGPWNSTNAESLIRYTVNKGYTNVHGWELGNEVSGRGEGVRIEAEQYAADVKILRSLLDEIYDNGEKALVAAPGGNFLASWYSDFVGKTAPDNPDVVSYHVYSLGPGSRNNLTEEILDPAYMDHVALTFSTMQSILQVSGTSAVAWISEAGGAFNGGRDLVTNAFVSSFWYLDQLGLSSIYNTKTYCRQCLTGGFYGLLNTTTFKPNPDYYSALLYHRLMGPTVLATSFHGSKKIRAYANCAKQSDGITLLLINLDGETTTRVDVHVTAGDEDISDGRDFGGFFVKEEYHLTAGEGDLHSQTMLLNGETLKVGVNGEVPSLEPVVATNASEPITLAPFSIVFAHFPNSYAPACFL